MSAVFHLKYRHGARRGKPVNHSHAQEKGNLCQARENRELVSSARKHGTNFKRGKTCNLCQARENMELVFSVGKHATCAKRGKSHESQ